MTNSATKIWWLVILTRMFTALVAWAGQTPGSGIIGSAHDFTNSNGEVYLAGGQANVCIICHIQDGAKAAPSPPSVQLVWNHKLSVQPFFWSKQMLTQAGTPLPRNLGTWAGSSKFCLSCHDGTRAVRDVYKGDYLAISFVGGTVNANGRSGVPKWANDQPEPKWAKRSVVDGTGKIGNNRFRVATGGDLDGTHPVGIPYPYLGGPSTYNGITTGTQVDLSSYVPSPTQVQLFSDVGGDVAKGPQLGAAGIECASCHDVHNEAVRGPYLLRDTAEHLCFNCHDL